MKQPTKEGMSDFDKGYFTYLLEYREVDGKSYFEINCINNDMDYEYALEMALKDAKSKSMRVLWFFRNKDIKEQISRALLEKAEEVRKAEFRSRAPHELSDDYWARHNGFEQGKDFAVDIISNGK